MKTATATKITRWMIAAIRSRRSGGGVWSSGQGMRTPIGGPVWAASTPGRLSVVEDQRLALSMNEQRSPFAIQ